MWEVQYIQCRQCMKGMGVHRPVRPARDGGWQFWTDFIELHNAIKYLAKSVLTHGGTCKDCRVRLFDTETKEAIPFELFS